jgi:hypothetical protein
VRGDDYSAEDGRAITFSSTKWPDLTAATEVRLTIRRRPGAFAVGAEDDVWLSVADIEDARSVGGATQSVTFEFSASETTKLEPAATAAGKFDVQAKVDGRTLTLVVGRVAVVEDQTR